MNLAIILTHNKGDIENAAQIEALKPLIEKQTVLHDELDEQGQVIGQFETYYYTLKGLAIQHTVKFYQIVPFGVSNPSNLYDIDSHKVFYGKGDEDKIGDHPRFFNWGLKRGTDQGADIVIYLDDYKSFSVAALAIKLNEDKEFNDSTWGKVTTAKTLKEVGQLKEDRSLTDAITEYRQRIDQKGLDSG